MDGRDWMRRALDLAESGLGQVWPNPSVGAVVVRDHRVVGAARTQKRGRPHAEVVALREAGELARGATMYVSLEPCSHWGRTPPCCEAIIGAGISRVVVATLDPDPRVNGRGLEMLKAAGIEVELGLESQRAQAVNAGFFSRVRLGRPLVRAVPSLVDADVPEGFDATLARDDDGWVAAVATSRDPVEIRRWRLTADPDGAAVVSDITEDANPSGVSRELGALPPEAVLATLGHEGLTRVAVSEENRAAALLRANDLLDETPPWGPEGSAEDPD